MTNLVDAIQNTCEIARQDERKKIKKYLKKKENEWNCCLTAETWFEWGKAMAVREIINELFPNPELITDNDE